MARVACELFVGRALDLRAQPGAWLASRRDPDSLLAIHDGLRRHVAGIAVRPGGAADDVSYAEYGGSGPVVDPESGKVLRASRMSFAWHLRLAAPEPGAYRYLSPN